MADNIGKLVHVTWRDSCSPTRKWQPAETVGEYDDAHCESVGWLCRHDKKCLVLSASKSPEEIGDITAIPAGAVRKVRRLK